MGTKHHKKNQPAQNNQRDPKPQPVPPEKEKIHGKMENKGSSNPEGEHADKIPSSGELRRLRELRELFASSRWSERFLTTFTGILAAMALIQGFLLWQQIGAIHVDQRPWINPKVQTGMIGSGNTVEGTLRLLNSGKSPARDTKVVFMVKFVKNGEEPVIDYPPDNQPSVKAAVVYPNDPLDAPIQMYDWNTWNRYVVTPKEGSDFKNGDAFIITYGIVTYKDFFGIGHLQHFCQFSYDPDIRGKKSGISARTCIDYSDVDENN